MTGDAGIFFILSYNFEELYSTSRKFLSPLTNAVCCADHLHCCPHSYICDVKNYRCTKGEISIPFFKKMVSKFVKKNLEFAIALIEQKSIIEIASRDKKVNPEFEAKSVVCPDGCSFCPNKYSCCRMSDGSYGCCPLPNVIGLRYL